VGNRSVCHEVIPCGGCIATGSCGGSTKGRFPDNEKYYVRFDKPNLHQIAQQHPRIGFILATLGKAGNTYKDWVFSGPPMELKVGDIDIALRLPTVDSNYHREFADRAALARKDPKLREHIVKYVGVSEVINPSSGPSTLVLKIRALNPAPNEPTFTSFVMTLKEGPVWTIKDWRFEGLVAPAEAASSVITASHSSQR